MQMVRWVLELKAIRWILDKFRRRFMNGDEHVQPPSTAQSSSAAFNGAHDFPFDMRYSDQQYAYAENCVKVIEAMSAKEILQRLLECDSSDPYEILGVNHAATQAQVKKAYVDVIIQLQLLSCHTCCEYCHSMLLSCCCRWIKFVVLRKMLIKLNLHCYVCICTLPYW